MSPEVKSVTAAFVVIFIVIAARHQWLSSFTGWLKAAPKSGVPAGAQAAAASQNSIQPGVSSSTAVGPMGPVGPGETYGH